jgi:hypothetical protein
VRNALKAPDEELIERGLEQARSSSWECIVADMGKIMRAAIAARTVDLNEVKDAHVQSQVQVLRSAQDDNALAAASTRAKRHPARTQTRALSEATGT